MTTSGATVTWTTDEPASLQVEYGTTTAYGSATTLDTTLATSHSQPLTGLTRHRLPLPRAQPGRGRQPGDRRGLHVHHGGRPRAITINCWDDAHQAPVLATTTNATDIGLTDGKWTEFLYTAGRSFPTVVAGASEYENYGLPAMRFFTSGLANGTYDVYANLYTQATGRNMRYY